MAAKVQYFFERQGRNRKNLPNCLAVRDFLYIFAVKIYKSYAYLFIIFGFRFMFYSNDHTPIAKEVIIERWHNYFNK